MQLINYASSDLREQIKALTGGKGVDVVYDPVGGAYAEPAVRSLALLWALPRHRLCQR